MKSLLAISLIASIATTSQADYLIWCHWYDLETRLGEGNMPDGDGVFAAMVELEDGNGNYALDECTPYGCDPEFDWPDGPDGPEGPIITHKSGASKNRLDSCLYGRPPVSWKRKWHGSESQTDSGIRGQRVAWRRLPEGGSIWADALHLWSRQSLESFLGR